MGVVKGVEDVTTLPQWNSPEERRRARRAVAERAETPAECRDLLDMLGLLEEP